MRSLISSAPERAIAATLLVVAIVGCDRSGKESEDADSLVSAACEGIRSGDFSAAASSLVQAKALAGDDADVRLLEAQMAYYDKDYEKAVTNYLSVAEDKAESAAIRAQAYAGVGAVELTRNSHDAARVALLKAVLLDRRNAVARYHLGLLYRNGFGYREAAIEQFACYAHLDDPASERVKRVERHTIPDIREDMKRALASRPGATSRNAQSGAVAFAKGAAAFAKGAFKEARRHYEEALKADPLSDKAAEGLYRVLLKTDASPAGRRKALSAGKTACALRPDSVSLLLEVGALAAKIGQNSISTDAYSRALAADAMSVPALDGLIAAYRASKRNKIAAAYRDYRDAVVATHRKR